MGMRPCKGQVNFDDINISTASEADNVGNDILPPRLPLQKIKEAVLIDISKQANRRLSDEADNDGKGGWTDQGSGTDMRGLKTGERRLGGVMFRILPDDANAVIVLKSANRLKGDLPDKVTIPVGKKLDTLFFLHSAAWCPTGSEETFHYVIHYADGKDITLQVTGNNLVDWIKDPVARFPLEEETFTTVVETVKNAQFRQGSLYRMEWSASLDRRGLEIKSIDFVSGGKAVPILLAITGVVEW
jgi:beta-galactosidase